ncbi:60S ribosomal protein L27 (nucleomorph) [Cryptomonas paramecium]|uniref:60S ribosomal protein L27 n=1 Tax=Cryptomonas paramaecium TaxID=2898 RepID=F2HIH3_9CRYP|nr:60S ribosomal protein L27 [Cryptomonas paramecium]AEA39097.1 60S ribosomal protein L27 [Cryptomonas paramecium]|mmetsp:Transcript_71269/g.190273  ORF Transcript_71269/g.190273 Transcript_71269/m.190273 type:complete len:141 (-) Transcript_71269:1563-1985(-)
MALIHKQGKIVILLSGRFAGCKAVIVSNNHQRKKFENCVLLGISKYPSRYFKKKSKVSDAKSNKIKVFIKKVNKNHFFVTRYNVNFGEENGKLIRKFALNYIKNKKLQAKNNGEKNFIKNLLSEQCLFDKNKWFFERLKF